MSQLRTFATLLMRDLTILRASLVDNLIDSMIIVLFTYLVFGRMMPVMGLNEALVTPIFFGILVVVLFNIAYDRALRDVFDLDSWRVIDHHRILPLSSSLLLTKYLMSYLVELVVASVPILVMGHLIYGSLLHVENMNIPLFLLAYFLAMVVISTLFLLIAIRWPLRWVTANTWPRIALPLILLGSLYYPWATVNDVAPWLSKFMLLLPTLYIVEGLRYAVTGNAVYLSWKITLPVLLLMQLVLLVLLKKSFVRRLDPVQEDYA